jgi:hypothetical protein
MNKPIFNKEYWLNQLINEVGFPGVPYEELDQYTVDFGSVIGQFSEHTKTAKQYIDEQLVLIEAEYEKFEDEELIEFTPTPNFSAVSDRLSEVSDSLANTEYLGSTSQLDNISQLEVKQLAVEKSDIRAFGVTINEVDYVVMMNLGGSYEPWRYQDQINHIVNTSFFVEHRDPALITDQDTIISYYQFVSAIEPFLKPVNDITAYEMINKDINTVFDGIKLEGF